jgi:hypothetical protein
MRAGPSKNVWRAVFLCSAWLGRYHVVASTYLGGYVVYQAVGNVHHRIDNPMRSIVVIPTAEGGFNAAARNCRTQRTIYTSRSGDFPTPRDGTV